MYRIESGIFIQFSHHVPGHPGACISLHGHTWKFVLCLGARTLDDHGFVVDFDQLTSRVLLPCHRLLDHSLALGVSSFLENRDALTELGHQLLASRRGFEGEPCQPLPIVEDQLEGAHNELPGGIKVAVFPFVPTSERLAEWLFRVAQNQVGDNRVKVLSARVYESLHPVEVFAEYVPDS